MNEMEPADRTYWGIRPGAKPAQRVVSEVSRLLALTGPSVVAVDQIDTILARSDLPELAGGIRNDRVSTVNLVGDGLSSLREITRRTVSVVSCLPDTWDVIRRDAVSTVRERFRPTTPLALIEDGAIARAIITRRLELGYDRARFTPPYDTWPVRPEAFERPFKKTPRQLLQAVDAHLHVSVCATTPSPSCWSSVAPAARLCLVAPPARRRTSGSSTAGWPSCARRRRRGRL